MTSLAPGQCHSAQWTRPSALRNPIGIAWCVPTLQRSDGFWLTGRRPLMAPVPMPDASSIRALSREVNVGTGTVTHSPKLNMLCRFPPDATPSVAEFQAHYSPGELERIHTPSAQLASRGEKRMEADLRLIWPDGTPKWVRLRAQEIPESDGKRIIGVLYDITERKYAEERTELIARELRHRIKNSLAVLQSIASQSIRGHSHPEDGWPR